MELNSSIKKTLSFLLKDIEFLPKVGEKKKAIFSRLNCKRIIDLLWHAPSNVILKRHMPELSDVKAGEYITTKLSIYDFDSKPTRYNRRKPFKIYGNNGSNFVSLIYFNYYPDYLIKSLKRGDTRIVSGKVERFGNQIQIIHPDYITKETEEYKIPKAEVIYHLTYGITSKQIFSFLKYIIANVDELPEWIPSEEIKHYNWPSFRDAIEQLHNPQNIFDLSVHSKPKCRLAYDELLANQLAINLMRHFKDKGQGRIISTNTSIIKKLLDLLGFTLTEGQQSAISEITKEQQSDHRMMRLIQGDVGSGKTLVALCAMLNVFEHRKITGNPTQAALMVPTDILANQHYRWISDQALALGIKVELLTGKITGKKRQKILNELKLGEIDFLIGTHALFQDEVEFKDLALVVIDEQHRFGVEQRIRLMDKGNKADLLVMTATPIPRTLCLAMYGDMDVTKILDKPKGRKPIKTSTINLSRVDEIINSLGKLIEQEEKIYWICPLVEDKENEGEISEEAQYNIKLMAAEKRYKELNKIYPNQVGLVHGKMKPMDKDNEVAKFAKGDKSILVATTVIEVGIDVPDATVIVIEHAERFGLAQLHQLRGRVGRGSKQSNCILLYSYPLSEVGKERLKAMRETNDGFLLSEKDLELRGGGDLMGTKQSGLPEFKIADFFEHQDLLKDANLYAKEITKEDPYLTSEKGRNLRILLKLFGYESSKLA